MIWGGKTTPIFGNTHGQDSSFDTSVTHRQSHWPTLHHSRHKHPSRKPQQHDVCRCVLWDLAMREFNGENLSIKIILDLNSNENTTNICAMVKTPYIGDGRPPTFNDGILIIGI